MSNTPSEELRLLLQEARSALWQPANAELCERIDDALARWGTPQPVVREPLALQQIAKAFAEAGLDPDDYPDDVLIEPLVRSIERAHGITQKGGSNAE